MTHDQASSVPHVSGTELDIRLLRYFVVVAEELHFTRAAARLYVAQQALSRDIRRLERVLGTPLFVRTTRRVTLTPEGERLLDRARDLLALHDLTVREVAQPARPVVVDLMSEGRRTGTRVLERARSQAPGIEFRGRYGGGMQSSISALLAGAIDVAFGRAEWLDAELPPGLERQLVRLEPLALVLPAAHPLAAGSSIPVASLRGEEIDANPAHSQAPEWLDLARQFAALSGARQTAPHVAALGADDVAHHLVRQGLPILASVDVAEVAGGVVRPLVDPVPLYPWSIVRRRGPQGAGVAAVERAAATLSVQEGWLDRPAGTWLPEPEASRLQRG